MRPLNGKKVVVSDLKKVKGTRKSEIMDLLSENVSSMQSEKQLSQKQSDKGVPTKVAKADKKKETSENISYVGQINNNNINNFFIQDPSLVL